MNKGKKVYVEGYLQTRSWDDATTGQKRYKTEIVADNIILLSSAGGANTGGDVAGFSAAAGDDQPTRAKAKAEEDISIEDIPF